MGKIGNALKMLRILESGQIVTVKELADRLEVSPRMVKTYKEELEKSGLYIDTIRGQYGGYVYHQKHDYQVSFDYLDVDAIESIMDKLTDKEREKISIPLEKLRALVIYSADEERNFKVDKEDIQKKYSIINNAKENKKELIFKYHNKVRKFIPHYFTSYKDFTYITGYSILENDIKTLNLSGIEDLKINEKDGA